MFDRYTMFQEMMHLVSEFGEVTDADMNNYSGEIEVHGRSGGTSVKIRVSIEEEAEQDAEELE